MALSLEFRRDDHLYRLRCHRCDHYESCSFGASVTVQRRARPRYSGVSTSGLVRGICLSSACVGAATVMMARFNSARAGYAESYLLITIPWAVSVDQTGASARFWGWFSRSSFFNDLDRFNLLGLSPT
jgi:hypothetical protein